MGIETGTAILGSAAIGGGLGLLGMESSRKAASRATDAQSRAADAATQAQLDMYYQSREDMAPWREAGVRSLADLERLQGTYEGAVFDPNKYMQSPGYSWLQQQGIDALSRGASATGKLGSGQYSKDLMRFGQGLALQDYTGYLGRLESLMNRYAGTSGVGQTASGQLANLGQSTAANLGNIYQNQGNAIATGQINQANARTGLYSNLAGIGSNAVNQYMLNSYLNNLGGSASSGMIVPSIPNFQIGSLTSPYGSGFGG